MGADQQEISSKELGTRHAKHGALQKGQWFQESGSNQTWSMDHFKITYYESSHTLISWFFHYCRFGFNHMFYISFWIFFCWVSTHYDSMAKLAEFSVGPSLSVAPGHVTVEGPGAGECLCRRQQGRPRSGRCTWLVREPNGPQGTPRDPKDPGDTGHFVGLEKGTFRGGRHESLWVSRVGQVVFYGLKDAAGFASIWLEIDRHVALLAFQPQIFCIFLLLYHPNLKQNGDGTYGTHGRWTFAIIDQLRWCDHPQRLAGY